MAVGGAESAVGPDVEGIPAVKARAEGGPVETEVGGYAGISGDAKLVGNEKKIDRGGHDNVELRRWGTGQKVSVAAG